MSRFGKADVYQFAIATGLDHDAGAQAPLLKAPPGEDWELVHIQFVTDWYTVWRRQRNSPAAQKEAEQKPPEAAPPEAPVEVDVGNVYEDPLK